MGVGPSLAFTWRDLSTTSHDGGYRSYIMDAGRARASIFFPCVSELRGVFHIVQHRW